MTDATKQPLDFEVVFLEPRVSAEKAGSKKSSTKEIKTKEKKDYDGIRFSRFGMFPTCVFCGLVDLGKDASERPDFKHQTTCLKRTLTPKPFLELLGVRSERTGAFVGEAPTIHLRIPKRLIRKIKIPILDERGNPTGQFEETFVCSYKWVMTPSHDWAWNGTKWVEWFVYTPERFTDPKVKPEPTENERKWLMGFVKDLRERSKAAE